MTELNVLVDGIDNRWASVFRPIMKELFVKELEGFLATEMATSQVCPEPDDWFRAFKTTPPEQVKCVIIGQDPYMNGEAMGLSFSVKPGYKLTPSARNIVKELTGDSKVDHNGDFSHWADQGVLMLNSCLTTRFSEPGAHGKQGWELLTSYAIDYLSTLDQPIIYLAWGKWAHNIAARDTNPQHAVIRTSHPSPLAATRSSKNFPAFIGSECFVKANDFLERQGCTAVQWLPALEGPAGSAEERQGSLL